MSNRPNKIEALPEEVRAQALAKLIEGESYNSISKWLTTLGFKVSIMTLSRWAGSQNLARENPDLKIEPEPLQIIEGFESESRSLSNADYVERISNVGIEFLAVVEKLLKIVNAHLCEYAKGERSYPESQIRTLVTVAGITEKLVPYKETTVRAYLERLAKESLQKSALDFSGSKPWTRENWLALVQQVETLNPDFTIYEKDRHGYLKDCYTIVRKG